MQKLLALVLSVSVLVSNFPPAWSQAQVGRALMSSGRKLPSSALRGKTSSFSAALSRSVFEQTVVTAGALRARILAGQTDGIAQYILSRPAALQAPLLRNEFVSLSLIPQAVTPAQRLQAAEQYVSRLQNTHQTLQVSYNDLTSFLTAQEAGARPQQAQAVSDLLADASALGLVGTRDQAPVLVDFYKQAQGTLFEDTAALIAARGLLRMQAYEELSTLLAEAADKPVLKATAVYCQEEGLAVEIPAPLQNTVSPQANSQLANFLEGSFVPNRLHADPSVRATRLWIGLNHPAQTVSPEAATSTASHTPSSASSQDVPASSQAVSISFNRPRRAALQIQVVEPVAIPTAEVTQPAAQAAPQTAAAVVTPSAPRSPAVRSASSAVLYSGFPLFSLINVTKRIWAWARGQGKKAQPEQAPYEEPGLHERSNRPIYALAEEEGTALESQDLLGNMSNEDLVLVGEDGFKLTLEDENKVEHILHNVELEVSSSVKNFSTKYNRLALDTNYIFELRNQTLPATRPDHFYFLLSTANGEFGQLLEGAKALQMHRPLRVKIQRTASPKKTVTLQVVGEDLAAGKVLADVDMSLLTQAGVKDGIGEGKIYYYNNTLYFRSKSGEVFPLTDAFVRLPKTESRYWTKILQMYPQTKFHLGVFATQDKMPPVTYLVPMEQIGLGKTLSPVLNDMAHLGEDTSSVIMSSINNVLPGLMVFVHPLLKRYGEAAVLRVGAAMFSVGGLTALASGFYGHAGDQISNLQLAGFIVSSICIALGTSLTRFVQNLVMSANRGIVPQASSFKKAPKVVNAQAQGVTYDASYLAKRMREVFTKKSSESLRDVVYFQRGAMFKNLGTMTFLALPWLANWLGKITCGVDLGLDFSASYVPYTLYSLYTLRRIMKTQYKDAYPRDLTILTNNLQDTQSRQFVEIAKIIPEQVTAQHPVIQEVARQLKSAIEALAPVAARQNNSSIYKMALQYEEQSLQEISELLRLAGREEAQVQAVREALQSNFDSLGHRDVNDWKKAGKVALMTGMPAALTAMTMATFGELGLSNEFAFFMREILGKGTAATGATGLILYGFMFGWRIIGNWLSQRLSGGSMYLLSSLASIGGPALMALGVANQSTAAVITGAIVAVFGTSNFFSQMYEYMTGLYPKYKREISLLINLTMPLAAVPMGYLRSDAVRAIPGLGVSLVGLAMLGSVIFTPGMLANSSIVYAAKRSLQKLSSGIANSSVGKATSQGWQQFKTNLKNYWKKVDGNQMPAPGGFVGMESTAHHASGAPVAP